MKDHLCRVKRPMMALPFSVCIDWWGNHALPGYYLGTRQHRVQPSCSASLRKRPTPTLGCLLGHRGGQKSQEHHKQERRAVLTTRIHIVALLALLAWCAAPSSRTTPVGRLHRSHADSVRTDWDGRGPRPLEATIWYAAAAGSREAAWEAGVFRFGYGAPDAPFADVVPHPRTRSAAGMANRVASDCTRSREADSATGA
jgi:hypothetical protein